MHRADIMAALIKRGTNQTQLAAELGVSSSLVSRVISGQATSRRVAEAVAQATRRPVERLWPGRYDQPDPQQDLQAA